MWRRYGARGAVNLEIISESQSFLDEVINDLGLNPYRKEIKSRWRLLGWISEWFAPYQGGDYQDIVEDFLKGVKRKRKTQ